MLKITFIATSVAAMQLATPNCLVGLKGKFEDPKHPDQKDPSCYFDLCVDADDKTVTGLGTAAKYGMFSIEDGEVTKAGGFKLNVAFANGFKARASCEFETETRCAGEWHTESRDLDGDWFVDLQAPK